MIITLSGETYHTKWLRNGFICDKTKKVIEMLINSVIKDDALRKREGVGD